MPAGRPASCHFMPNLCATRSGQYGSRSAAWATKTMSRRRGAGSPQPDAANQHPHRGGLDSAHPARCGRRALGSRVRPVKSHPSPSVRGFDTARGTRAADSHGRRESQRRRTGTIRAPGSVDERLHDAADLLDGQRMRHRAHRGRRQPTVPPSSSPRQRAGRSLLARRGSRDTSGIASGVGQLWIAIAAPWLWPNSTIRVHAACCSSFHMSVPCGVVSPREPPRLTRS